MKTITQKYEQHAAACCSETKNRYICISEESEGSYPDTLFETLPGFQTSGGCHLTKACWDEAWLLDDTDRALVRDGEGYALLRIRSGQLIRLDCDCAAPYGDTLLHIRRNGKYGLMDFGGRTIIPPRYDVLTNHFAQFNIIGRRGRYGLLNRLGGWAQPLRYDVILPVSQRGNDRLACIRRHKVVFL